MALSFSALEAVKFGELVALPTVTAESRLRIQSANFKTAEGREKLINAMAACFKDHVAEVADFMTTQMSNYELSLLQAYLVGGDLMLNDVRNSVLNAMQNGVQNA